MGRKTLGSLAVVFGLAFGAASLSAQAVRVGGQVSFADDADFGLGPRIAFALSSLTSGLWLVGSFDYFFPDQGLDGMPGNREYWEINSNLLYHVDLVDATNLEPYFGAGLNVARRTIPSAVPEAESTTRLGLNLVGGLNFPLAGLTPFVELRFEIAGGEQFVIAGGILFP